MLVLRRKRSEKIIIKVDNIEIEVILVDSNNLSVALGFIAPSNVKILRSELTMKK